MFEGVGRLALCGDEHTSGGDRQMTDSGYDEPLADVVEQNQPASPSADESEEPQLPEKLPLEADAADAAEQAREVGLDEEDYR
jgi:hypothetical protein